MLVEIIELLSKVFMSISENKKVLKCWFLQSNAILNCKWDNDSDPFKETV